MPKSSIPPKVGKSVQKPNADYPLWLHKGTQRWTKKIGGKFHYFGPAADWQGALERYHELLAGRSPDGDSLSVAEAVNHFLTAKKAAVKIGELSPYSFSGYLRTCGRIVEEFGRGRCVASLTPVDFLQLKAAFAENHATTTLAVDVQQTKTLFKWLSENNLIDKPVKFGSDFRRPSKKKLREARYAKGERMFTPEQLREILRHATQPLHAMTLLAVSAGFGPTDVAKLRFGHLALDSSGDGWINFARSKTAIMRRAWVWPEVHQALDEAAKQRPKPASQEAAEFVFLNARGKPWTGSDRQNLVTRRFRAILDRLGFYRPGLGFCTCRHVFATIAGDTGDQVAVNYVIGHSDTSIASVHRERIADSRLRGVSDHVRRWLFQDKG